MVVSPCSRAVRSAARIFAERPEVESATSTSQTRIDYYKIVLEDVIVSSVQTKIDSDNELPAETFGLKYGKITWEYKQHKHDGSASSTGIAGWDLRKNVAV